MKQTRETQKPFSVIPGLTFESYSKLGSKIPAGVYPCEYRDRNDRSSRV